MMLRSWQRYVRNPVGRLEYGGFVRDLAQPIPVVASDDHLRVRLAGHDDIPRLLALMHAADYQGNRMGAPDIERRLGAGDMWVLGEVAGELAALSWVRFDSATFRKGWLRVPLKPDEAYLAWTHTQPRHRGKGVATRLAQWRLWWLRERGIRFAYSWISPTNTAMLHVTDRVGAVRVSQLVQYYPRLLRRPRVNIVRVDAAAPHLTEWCSSTRMRFPHGLSVFVPMISPAPRPAAGPVRTA